MAASSIFFNGRLIRTPGAYSYVDASGLEQIGLGASGIVAILGEAEGGIPMSEITDTDDLLVLTKPEAAQVTFRSGALHEACGFCFNPSNDPEILGGAQAIIACKINPASQSTAKLSNTYGDAIDLSSADYGAFTEQINVTVGDGTNQGKLITITFEDEVESVDDLGGDVMFSLSYVDSGAGWDTMTAEVESGGAVVAKGTKTEAGLDGEITAQPSGASVMSVVSSDASDTSQQIVIYGMDSAGTALTSETLNLNGTTTVTGTTSFSAILGARIIGTTAGTITMQDDDPVTILTIAAGTNPDAGIVAADDVYVAGGDLDVVADGATTKRLALIGLSDAGAAQQELFTLTGTTTVSGSAKWSEIQYIALGEVEATVNVTMDGEAARSVPSTHNTLQKVADYYNARSRIPVATTYGFVFTLVTGLTSLDPDNLDTTTGAGGAVSCLSPTNPDFYADQYLIVDWINNNSQYVAAEISSGAVGGAPSNTASPVFLSGGSEGTSTTTHWQNALNLLKQVRANSIVVLTEDPSVHAMVNAHCAYMGGAGKSERDGFVGILNSGGTALPTKTEIKSQIVDLNSRHIRVAAQSVDRYNSSGEREEFDPPYLAAILAGMQAGSPVGTPLTHKYVNALNIKQDSSWNPTDDSEEMLEAGLCFLEKVSGVGIRVVRNITSYLASSNLAYTEGSVNEAVNYATYNFRTRMEAAVGKKGFAGTIIAAKSVAMNILDLMVDEKILVAWRSLSLELSLDTLEVSVEMAPVLPINFVPITVHLVTIPLTV